MQRKFGLQRVGRVGGDEELDLVVGDATAHVVAALAQVGVAVAHHLGGRRGQFIDIGSLAGYLDAAGRFLNRRANLRGLP